MNDDNTQATNLNDSNPAVDPQVSQPAPQDNPAPFTPPAPTEETPAPAGDGEDGASPAPADEPAVPQEGGAGDSPADDAAPQDDGAAPVNPA